ncbi:MAG: hypothetical protein ACYCO9_16385 [Streptosporangiaceae bacterium]
MNAGNWTTSIAVDDVSRVGITEIYHAVVEGNLPGAYAVVKINERTFSFTQPVSGAEWDPVNPPLLRRGETVYFLWNTPATETAYAPVVTTWWRFDPAIPANVG